MINRTSIWLHLSCSVWVNVSMNWRPFLPSQYFTTAILSVGGMLYDMKTLFASNLKFLSPLYLSSTFPLNEGCFIMGLAILGPTFYVPSCLMLFSAMYTASPAVCTIALGICFCLIAIFCICNFSASIIPNCL